MKDQPTPEWGNVPLISVIVPVYNVEKYVRKCLESLKGQTLKQIEVIMVDDGSTDNSGEIAEEYVSDEWPKFRLIKHRENRGLSAARNTGIDESKADWIMFVDSDDWVEQDFCKVPYEATMENSADMVIFSAFKVKHGKIENTEAVATPKGFVDELTAHEYGGCVAWNKLYKRDLFQRVKYLAVRAYEDVATTHKFVHEAKRIYMIQEKLYYHLIRRGSITHSGLSKNSEDKTVSEYIRCRDLISYDYPEGIINQKIVLYGSAIGFLARRSDEIDDLYLRAKDVVDSIVGLPKELNWKQKAALIAWRIDERFFRLVSMVSGRTSNRYNKTP